HQSFFNKGNRALGFYTLLAAANFQVAHNLGLDQRLMAHAKEPLAKYLSVMSDPNRRLATPVGDPGGPKDGFVQQLSAFRDLYLLWNSGKALEGDAAKKKAEQERAIDYIKQNSNTVYGWALLGLVSTKVAGDAESQRALSKLYQVFEKVPGLG